MMKHYDYISESKKVVADFKANVINIEQAYTLLEQIEKTAYDTYPNAEPDGDITYCVSVSLHEIDDIHEQRR